VSFTDEECEAIVSYRIKKSKDTLEEAKGIAALGYWNAVANRLYYEFYHLRVLMNFKILSLLTPVKILSL
jgi:hypothetical protein